ncbi:hypothetical protein AMES_0875 [Amycolatopsis mediterranei S699]|uniref:Uncharacterized protein n=2 Tax=Amycolatopsis mediterranei TaxID=33910 RepID=A0A0H3CVN0_AMYMU|nr:hypothetical protein AMED_0878 [Amycolatopsis mediterranei U32]AEK39388.1 hypothetical protein RAM_04480 [Amycolatopsis mediterranei S699]AGT81540.1 hypothetical protein B737_0876 [Amycolatopsis mediterranei RB]KDO10003.1 hypothetical protein DV26_15090 [Amycolatopsis mediterranei]AFO74411.1 hypothetical protein AMES_0875 [Amycolatopsis mediterranei S699]
MRRHAHRRRSGRAGFTAGAGAHVFFFGGTPSCFVFLFAAGALDVSTCASVDTGTAVDGGGPELPHAGVHHQ